MSHQCQSLDLWTKTTRSHPQRLVQPTHVMEQLCSMNLYHLCVFPPLFLDWLPHVQIWSKVEKSQSVILGFSLLKLKQPCS